MGHIRSFVRFFFRKSIDNSAHLFYNINRTNVLNIRAQCDNGKTGNRRPLERKIIMNYETSTAKILEKEYPSQRKITRTDCVARRRLMIKQKLFGVMLICAAVFAVSISEDMQLSLALIPLGLYFMFTKKMIVTD